MRLGKIFSIFIWYFSNKFDTTFRIRQKVPWDYQGISMMYFGALRARKSPSLRQLSFQLFLFTAFGVLSAENALADPKLWIADKADGFTTTDSARWRDTYGPFPDLAVARQAADDFCRTSSHYWTPGLDCEPHPAFNDQTTYYCGGSNPASCFYRHGFNVYRRGGRHGIIYVQWYPYFNTDADCPAGQVIGSEGHSCVDGFVLDPSVNEQKCPDNESNPCNPATGNKYQVETDFEGAGAGSLRFKRHYNSSGPFKTSANMAAGWRHTYSRVLDERPDRAATVSFAAPVNQSSTYDNASDACTDGFNDIKAGLWGGDLASGIATFAGGNICKIEVGGVTKAYLPVRTATGWNGGFTAPAGFKTITRADGNIIRFEQDGANWVNTLDQSLRLESVGSDWVFTTRDDTRETYNSDGKLVSIAYRNGQTETLDYSLTAAQGGDDDSETLDRVTGPFGHTLNFGYDSSGRLATVTGPDGTVQFAYDLTGNLELATYPDANTRRYHYEDIDLPNHLTGITDENLARFATWAYDDSGRALLSEHAGGKEQVQFLYNADGSTTLNMGSGATRTYHYTTTQGIRRLQMLVGDVCSTCPDGNVADRVYDSSGFLYETQDWNGNLTQTIRNSRGLTESLVEAKGSAVERTTSIAWNPVYRLPDVVTSPKNTTTYLYDAAGNAEDITITAPGLSRAWAMTYNASGQVLTIDGPRTDVADVTTINYYNCTTGNECGQIHTVTNALGHVTTYNSYDAAGRPTLITDPNGLQTSLVYDWRGNVEVLTLTTTVGVPRVTLMTYDAVGQLKTVSTPDGMTLTYTYTDAHYLDLVEDNLGNKIDYDYDAMGNLINEDVKDVSNVLERATSYVFDLNNRLDTITSGGHVTDVQVDDLGNLTNVVDPKFASTQHLYDALNRLDSTTDALLGVTDYHYDAHDNLETVVAANGATTSFLYNDLDDLEQETSPDRGITTYTHDEAGNVKTKVDARGKLTSYDYDALNRLTLETLDDGSTIVYEYDTGPNALGRLNKVTDPSGSTAWLFDHFGAVTHRTQLVGTVSLTTQYVYDNEGRMQAMIYPSGKLLSYGYNSYQISSLSVDGTPLVQNLAYEPFGPAKSWLWGDGRSFSRDFDLRGLMISITDNGDTQALNYDAAGFLTSQFGLGVDVTYDYDLLGRVTDFADNLSGGGSPPESMFVSAPTVLATVQTANNETGAPASTNPTPWLTAAVRNVTSGNVQLALGRAEVNTGAITVAETVGYVAIQASASGSFTAGASIVNYEAQTTTDSVRGWGNGCYTTNFLNVYAGAPLVVGTINRHDGGDGGWARRCSLGTSSVGFAIDEDQFRDTERNHTTETVGFAAFSSAFDGVFSDGTGTWAMEAESTTLAATTTDPAFKTVNFRQSYATPPVVIVLATNETPDPSAFRIRNVTTTGFEVVQVEPANADGTQGAMTLHYLAVEPGEHELPDGTRILAATVDITDQQHGSGVSGTESWHTETFADWPGTSGGLPTLVYDYDANGNRTLLTEDSLPYSYFVQPNSNRLLSTAGPVAKTYSHDTAGNTLSDGVHTYGYNDRGRLVDVDSGMATYVHNGLGQRVSKTVTSTTLFAYDEAGALIGQYDGTGAAEQEFVWLDGAPIGLLVGSQVLYVQTDQIGTPRAVYDGAAALWRWKSTPFGMGGPDEDADGDGTDFEFNLRFAGQYEDGETGLYYNYYRTYDPTTGRYLESDPIGLDGGLNSYGYVGGNPLSYVDPYGLYRGSVSPEDLVAARQLMDKARQQRNFREFQRLCRIAGHQNCDQPWEGENESMCFVGDAMDVGFAALGARASASRLPASGLTPRLQPNLFNSLDDLFAGGRTPTASEISQWARQQGWTPSQTATGPLKYTDANGIVRATIKRGSSRAPGSGSPHVELRNASGQRIDPAGNPVNRRSLGNHTPIIYDIP